MQPLAPTSNPIPFHFSRNSHSFFSNKSKSAAGYHVNFKICAENFSVYSPLHV